MNYLKKKERQLISLLDFNGDVKQYEQEKSDYHCIVIKKNIERAWTQYNKIFKIDLFS